MIYSNQGLIKMDKLTESLRPYKIIKIIEVNQKNRTIKIIKNIGDNYNIDNNQNRE